MKIYGVYYIDNEERHRTFNYNVSCDSFKAVKFNDIMPRPTINSYKNRWFERGYDLTEYKHFVVPPFETKENNDNTECNNCEYSENCNGQMCFFSMM